MQFTIGNKYNGDCVIIPLSQQSLSQHLNDLATRYSSVGAHLQKDFSGAAGEVLLLYYPLKNKTLRIVLLGIGKNEDTPSLLKAFQGLSFKYKHYFGEENVIDCTYLNIPKNDLSAHLEALICGLVLGTYRIGLYKTAALPESLWNSDTAVFSLILPKRSNIKPETLENAYTLARILSKVYDYVNTPSNYKTPETLAKWAEEAAKRQNFKVKVYDKKEAKKVGFHALLAVGRGSENDPCMIVLDYKPKGIDKETLTTIAVVGKGITFDTGGISIKPSANMHYMRSDMAGAAAVLGIVEACAALKLPLHIVGVVAAAENMVGDKAYRPGDVIDSYSGKTIEVLDTDAEGRLVLADALAFACREEKPAVVIDMATLTGSCVRALGTNAAGLFTNNDTLAQQLLQAGERSGERLWRLPLWDAYAEELQSDIADVKISVSNLWQMLS
ncbi:MAG: leucyl aminopeptidase [Sphingobacteriales bacterium]|nr:leucyl aminopeptidase [Sphingobacteriales bacterium]